MSKGYFYRMHLDNLGIIPGTQPSHFILGAGIVGQNEIMSHYCGEHRVALIGLHAWEQIQEDLPTVRLDRDGHPVVAGVPLEPFEHEKHATLIAECQRCAQLKKIEPWKVYQP